MRGDVRYRAGGRAVRQIKAETITGPIADARRGNERLIDFAESAAFLDQAIGDQ
jgi:hypothetical protein